MALVRANVPVSQPNGLPPAPVEAQPEPAAGIPDLTGLAPIFTENVPAALGQRGVTVASEGMPVSNPMNLLAEMGFEGIHLGVRSFPLISLKTDGIFEDMNGRSFGKSFIVTIQSSRPKFAYRASPSTTSKDDVVFTWDKQTTSNGYPLEAAFNALRAKGKTIDAEPREYLDVLANIVAGEYEGEIVTLSVSPTSRDPFWGFMGRLARAYGQTLTEIPVEVYVGDKVTKGAVQPFYPWAFREAR